MSTCAARCRAIAARFLGTRLFLSRGRERPARRGHLAHDVLADAVKPQEGLEVVATGRLTTFPGKSSYQIVIEQLEPAGLGA